MNILIYSKHSVYGSVRIGGAETSLRLMGEKLVERGHDVFYLTSSSDAKSKKIELSVSHGVRVIFYPPFGNLFFQRIKKKLFGKKARRDWLDGVMSRLIVKNSIDLVYVPYDLEALDALLGLRDTHGFKIVMRMAGLKWYEKGKSSEAKKHRYERIFNAVDSINYNTPSLKDVC
jgi:hypothetical protein